MPRASGRKASDRAELIRLAEAKAELEEREASLELGKWIPFVDPSLICIKNFAPLYALWDRITVRGEQVFALVEAPPRHTKTTTCFHGFNRHLRSHPKHLVGYGSYNEDFAFQQSRLCRAMAARAGLWVSREQRTKDRFGIAQSVSHWQTHEGGGAKFLGRGGSAIGLGFNVFLVDDPLKNREEAESEVTCEVTWQWILGSILNRLEPGGSFLCMHQRWNDNDPIGRFKARIESGYADMPEELRGKLPEIPWEIISLPAILADGSPLIPQRYDELALARIRVEVGEYNWWSQYMQEPRPVGERLFPEAYPVWQPARDASGNELGLVVRGEWFPVPNLTDKVLVLAVDPATTDSDSSDWTAVVLLAFWWEWDQQTKRLELGCDVLRVWRERLKSPDVVMFVSGIARSLPGTPLVYEMAGGGREQAQFMERDHPDLPIHKVTTSSNKRLRASPVAGAAKRMRVRLPVSAPWLLEFRKELTKFTGSGRGKDDQVDALAHGWNFGLTLGRPSKGATGGERAIAAQGTGGF
ncbi:MAG: hypothetical protein ACOY0T_35685 [Myxococcota bacterium]